jgi:hypothetical protein
VSGLVPDPENYLRFPVDFHLHCRAAGTFRYKSLISNSNEKVNSNSDPGAILFAHRFIYVDVLGRHDRTKPLPTGQCR